MCVLVVCPRDVSAECLCSVLDVERVLELAFACPQDVFLGRHRMCPWGARGCGLWLCWGVFSRCHGVGSQAVVRISLDTLGMYLGCLGMCPGDVFPRHLGACSRSVSLECLWGVLECVLEVAVVCPQDVFCRHR